MKLWSAFATLLTLVAGGCGEPGSPVSPSSIQPGNNADAAVGAGSETMASAAAQVPFKGSLQGNADPPVFDPPPSPFFSAHLVAKGQATHLGQFTLDFSHRVNLDTLIGVGKALFTAANGDTLMTDVEGQATPAGSPTAFTVVETHIVTGGTGRFAGASGRFTITRAVDFATPFTSGEIDGWISKSGGGV